MADEELLRTLLQKSKRRNHWRREYGELKNLDISGSILTSLDLTNADLTGITCISADLTGSNLTGANLTGANLSLSNLTAVNFTNAKLSDADLFGTMLTRADFTSANLSRTIFTIARLEGTNLTEANLSDTLFTGSNAVRTIFSDIDLRGAKELTSVYHAGPSTIGINTIHKSEGDIPENFLRGCGLKEWEIEATKLYRTDLSQNQFVDLTYKIIELRTDPLIQFYSCFISYSNADAEFARRLYVDLQNRGVRCWFASEDMKIGDRIRNRIDDSILLHDKLLVIPSEASVTSQWIEQEVETALEKEREQRCDVLFPVRLDDTVMEVSSGWPALIRRSRHIGDFCKWGKEAEYKKGLERLLHDLRLGV